MKIVSDVIEAHVCRFANEQLEFLALKRSANEVYPNLWQMVSGRMNDGEAAFDAAAREINEETQIVVNELWVVPNVNSYYSAIHDAVSIIPVFLAIVESDCEVKLSDEHSEYKWVSFDGVCNMLAWQGQIESVKIIKQYLTEKKSFLNFVRVEI